jgi:hypothetical protein
MDNTADWGWRVGGGIRGTTGRAGLTDDGAAAISPVGVGSAEVRGHEANVMDMVPFDPRGLEFAVQESTATSVVDGASDDDVAHPVAATGAQSAPERSQSCTTQFSTVLLSP